MTGFHRRFQADLTAGGFWEGSAMVLGGVGSPLRQEALVGFAG